MAMRNILLTPLQIVQVACCLVLSEAFVPIAIPQREATTLNLNPSSVLSEGTAQLENLASSIPVDKLPVDSSSLPLDQLPSDWTQFPLEYALAAFALPVIAKFGPPLLKPRSKKPDKNTYPEGQSATYELLTTGPLEFGDAAFVRPLLKQTQLESRDRRVAYDAS